MNQNQMQKVFNDAKEYPEIKELVIEIEEIWKSVGSPEHDTGTTTETSSNRYMTEYKDSNDEPLVDKFNKLVDILYELIDEYYIGSGIWYSHFYSTPEWNDYVDSVYERIEEFIQDYLWNAVCDNW